jgi:oxygen-independent coproporphyrinogen-3 oxidase
VTAGSNLSLMTTQPPVDVGVLCRYDSPEQCHTPFPTAPKLSKDFGEEQLRRWAWRSNIQASPRPISLYVHVPCSYSAGFDAGGPSRGCDPARGEHYVARLLQELRLTAPLFDTRREVIELHLRGGAAHFLSPTQLSRLLAGLAGGFRLSRAAEREFSIDLDPRRVREGDVALLARLGFNRVSLGLLDFDARVQQAVNRAQSVGETLAVIEECRRSGLRSVSIDLTCGLPPQMPEGFARTLEIVIAARPERVAVRDHRQAALADLPGPDARVKLLQPAVDRLSAAGYRHIGMDLFALPEDDLARAQATGDLHRNFMGYTTHADCDLIGLGAGAISHIGSSLSQNHPEISGWEAALAQNQLPVARGLELG